MGEEMNWGTPSLRIGDEEIKRIDDAVSMEISELDERKFSLPNTGYSMSFSVNGCATATRNARRTRKVHATRKRLPRKEKKAFKKEFFKTFGVTIKRFHFNN